ncbi:MAG: hypothetical protein JW821_17065 [Deltaproteobacteria bacterium]|nr:hypothetical protein [Deltaproteobacteria bacterium]
MAGDQLSGIPGGDFGTDHCSSGGKGGDPEGLVVGEAQLLLEIKRKYPKIAPFID